jgi:SAM-dependent methyltransferase
MQHNAQQVEFWNGEAGRRWVEHDAQLERSIGALTPALLARVGNMPAARALDIGCGCGNQTLALARHLGTGARVTGVDISRPMLEVARARAATGPAAASVDFLLADAAAHPFTAPGFDLLFSRFGVMFFADPLAAWRNLHAACAPGARVVFCCWQAPALNDWVRLPLQAALRHVPAPAPADPHAPGPFAFADRARVTGILEAAGFGAVQFDDLQMELCFAEGDDLAAATEAMVQAGPVNALLAALEDGARARALDDIGAALAPHYRDAKMMMHSAAWLVSAKRSP